MESILDAGYKGPVYPVNPNLSEVLGRRTYPSIRDLPETVELAFVVIPARAVLDAVRDCIAAGVKGIVVITAGFSEVGEEGREAEREIARLCNEAGIPAVGPNCMGVVCFKSHLIGTMTMDRLQGEPGDVSFISQSGTYGISTLNQGLTAGVGFNKFVSTGNEAMTRFCDFLEYFGNDPETRVIIGYIESLKDAGRFVPVAREASKKKPIIVMKFGRTEAGTRAAASHTGALAGSRDIYAAAFKQSGVIEVTRTQDLLNMAVGFRTQPLPKGTRIGITGISGGFAVAASDYLAEHGLLVPELSQSLQQRMRDENIPPFAIVKNPIDLTAEIRPRFLLRCTEHLIKSDEVDAVIVGLWSYPLPPADESIRAFERMQQESGKPLLLCYYGSRRGAELIQGMTRSLPVYGTPEEVCQVMAGMCQYAQYRRKTGTFPRCGSRPAMQEKSDG